METISGSDYENELMVDESKVWNHSYDIGGNVLFYPHEEIVRFINRFIRKRWGFDRFENISPLLAKESYASLDLGCGMGRHVKFLDEFKLNPYGVDLSDTAIAMGKNWFSSIGRDDLAEKLRVASVADLPFPDDFFDICVSHGVLDSMPREIAQKGIEEMRRVLTPGGLIYLDLIMGSNHEGDEIVESGMEKGTIQSYFTTDTIRCFLDGFDILDFTVIFRTDDKGKILNKRAHLVIKNIK